ncbi:hypothetical protein F0562_022657 [Nyssa sinensis]|uniref:Uncharacterized protein n=1 Tax=Nyssa sinensis TaxID=561372 RepID=A0A5J5BEC1_9ASTE|nr:hypothetical protein F0562_022657 [Nyssa sinensis]
MLLLYGAPSTPYNRFLVCPQQRQVLIGVNSIPMLNIGGKKRSWPTRAIARGSSPATSGLVAAAAAAAAAAMILLVAGANAIESRNQQPETLSNIPRVLSGECVPNQDCKTARIQRPKSRKAESCTIKCVTTCIRGGDGSPGEGPLNIRRCLYGGLVVKAVESPLSIVVMASRFSQFAITMASRTGSTTTSITLLLANRGDKRKWV